jgi:hypothetical protein
MVEYLMHQQNWNGLHKLLTSLGRGCNPEKAISDVYGLSLEELAAKTR